MWQAFQFIKERGKLTNLILFSFFLQIVLEYSPFLFEKKQNQNLQNFVLDSFMLNFVQVCHKWAGRLDEVSMEWCILVISGLHILRWLSSQWFHQMKNIGMILHWSSFTPSMQKRVSSYMFFIVTSLKVLLFGKRKGSGFKNHDLRLGMKDHSVYANVLTIRLTVLVQIKSKLTIMDKECNISNH